MSSSKKILVTGANGQLGQMFQDIAGDYAYEFIFADRQICDVTSETSIEESILSVKPNVIINCAAYTAVDKAESDQELAYLINEKASKYLAKACKENNVLLVHFSSDYVYHLDTNIPLKETDDCQPVGIYAKSKRAGEIAIQEVDCKYMIFRTSWLYSEYGHNFVKTMLRLAESREELSIVNDQIGCPTYTRDLANAVMKMVDLEQEGIFNYANDGKISWADFAKEIFALANKKVNIYPISTSEYPTPTTRPLWSKMDLTKIENAGIKISDWKSSLRYCLERMK